MKNTNKGRIDKNYCRVEQTMVWNGRKIKIILYINYIEGSSVMKRHCLGMLIITYLLCRFVAQKTNLQIRKEKVTKFVWQE